MNLPGIPRHSALSQQRWQLVRNRTCYTCPAFGCLRVVDGEYVNGEIVLTCEAGGAEQLGWGVDQIGVPLGPYDGNLPSSLGRGGWWNLFAGPQPIPAGAIGVATMDLPCWAATNFIPSNGESDPERKFLGPASHAAPDGFYLSPVSLQGDEMIDIQDLHIGWPVLFAPGNEARCYIGGMLAYDPKDTIDPSDFNFCGDY